MSRTGYSKKNTTINDWRNQPLRDGRLDTRDIRVITMPRPILAKLRSFEITHICYLCACSREYLAYFTDLNDKQLDKLEYCLDCYSPNYKLQPHWTEKAVTHAQKLREWLEAEGETIFPPIFSFYGNILEGLVKGDLKEIYPLEADYFVSVWVKETAQNLINYGAVYDPWVEFEVKPSDKLSHVELWYKGIEMGVFNIRKGDEMTENERDDAIAKQSNYS